MTQQHNNILDHVKNRELAGVSFVRDYVQLLFYGPVLNAYVLPIVTVSGRPFKPGIQGYRDALCGLIGKPVASAEVQAKHRMRFEFVDGSLIEISLKDDDRTTPEAATLQVDAGKRWNVW